MLVCVQNSPSNTDFRPKNSVDLTADSVKDDIIAAIKQATVDDSHDIGDSSFKVGKNAHMIAAKEVPKVEEEVVGTGKVWEGAAAEEEEQQEEVPEEKEEHGAGEEDEVRASWLSQPSGRPSICGTTA